MNSKKKEIIPDKIFITGFMASGKSTFGRYLAEQLNKDFIDLDALIADRENNSIKEIFGHFGEAYFREKERQYLFELAHSFNGILSLGGGALQSQEVVIELKKQGLLLYIETPLEIIVERVFQSKERPILYNEEGQIKQKATLFDELKTLYLQRLKYYQQATITINTQKYSTVEEMVEAAIKKINMHG